MAYSYTEFIGLVFERYNAGISHDTSAPCSGLSVDIIASGQSSESGRDQAHTQLGLGNLAESCTISANQYSEDLWSLLSNRLLAGYEYTAECVSFPPSPSGGLLTTFSLSPFPSTSSIHFLLHFLFDPTATTWAARSRTTRVSNAATQTCSGGPSQASQPPTEGNSVPYTRLRTLTTPPFRVLVHPTPRKWSVPKKEIFRETRRTVDHGAFLLLFAAGPSWHRRRQSGCVSF